MRAGFVFDDEPEWREYGYPLFRGDFEFAAIQAVALSLGVEISAVNVHDAGEIERAVTAFARSSNGG
jgi:superfamily I DNA and RNA helicase